MIELFWTLVIIWVSVAVGTALASFILYREARNNHRDYPRLYPKADAEKKMRKHSRRFFLAYAWPVWFTRWLASELAEMWATVADMSVKVFGPQDKS